MSTEPTTTWVERTHLIINSADRFGDQDVVSAKWAMELAARLDECRKVRDDVIKQVVSKNIGKL